MVLFQKFMLSSIFGKITWLSITSLQSGFLNCGTLSLSDSNSLKGNAYLNIFMKMRLMTQGWVIHGFLNLKNLVSF